MKLLCAAHRTCSWGEVTTGKEVGVPMLCQNECQLCGRDGNIVACEKEGCDQVVCEHCILRVDGDDEYESVMTDRSEFRCFICLMRPHCLKREKCDLPKQHIKLHERKVTILCCTHHDSSLYAGGVRTYIAVYRA